MPHLIWSPTAIHDLQRLYRFLAPKNPDAAKRAVRAIRTGVKILAHQPEAGRTIDKMTVDYREWFIEFGSEGYLARYRYSGGAVTILSVQHGREASD
jgi:plasmid stabilization system protein ParE